ncbi:MAG: DeoR/GlpR family DNA-binding transcription regulator [Eubacteriales bacterium]|nr:DeoR/GlpR family DNA-binding transcription regulator [Eubacteriales bacterium]
MIASQRYEKIVEMVEKKGIVNTKEMARAMDVTETTIRRDCEELEKQGKLIRVHGGAKRVGEGSHPSEKEEKDFWGSQEHYEEKCQVCKRAADFVREGDCIFLDEGTTTVLMLQYLKGKSIKIVTHNLLVAEAFREMDLDAELFLIGGRYIKEFNMSVGPVALGDLSRFNFDHAFLGCAGVDMDRQVAYTTEVETMMIKEKAMSQSSENYLLMDSSKLTMKGFYSFRKTKDFDAILCNDCEALRQMDVPENIIVI